MTDDTDRDDREPTDAGDAGSGSADRTASGAAHGREAPLDPTDLDRLFDVLDAGVGEDAALAESEQDQLLSVLEAVLSSPAQVEGDELDRLFSVLESAVTEPTAPETAEEVLSVLEATLGNPARLDPTETEGLLSVLESAVVDPSDPGATAREVFSLVDALGLDTPATGSESEAETGAVDPADPVGSAESVLDSLGFAPGGAREGDPADADTGSGPSADSGADDSAATDAVGGAADDGRDRPFRVARIVAAATQRSTDYSLRSGVRTGTRLVRAVRESESIDELLDETRAVAFAELDRLGVDVGDAGETGDSAASPDADRQPSEAVLRERGARLLERSADVDHDESIHPAFPRLLDELAPDEARILRLLATEGPQASVDVRDVGWLPITSELVAAGLSMIGAEAGCRHADRTPASLNNLQRLGLIWFSDEPVRDVERYQVLEAQPHVAEAVDSCRRAKTIRRSIHLTPFGVDFCRVCLPVDVAAEDAAGAYEAPADLTE